MLDILVLSRSKAKDFRSELPWAAISVSTFKEDFISLSENNRIDLLQLEFGDTLTAISGVTLFNELHAKQILDFFQSNKHRVETLLIHCEGGRSRSPAIAAALSKIEFNLDSIYFKKFTPNSYVYKVIIESHFGKIVA